MSDTGGLGGAEEYDARGSFALRVTQRGYEIRDRRDPSRPIAEFPGTGAGLEAAEAEFERLVREERSGRDRWSLVLCWCLFVALGIWVVASATRAAVELRVEVTNNASRTMVRWIDVSATVQTVAFAVWVAALVVLVALWLRRNGRVIEQRVLGSESTAGPRSHRLEE